MQATTAHSPGSALGRSGGRGADTTYKKKEPKRPREVVENMEERPDDNRQKWRVGLARALPCFAVSGTSLGGPDELSGATTPGCKGALIASLCIVEASEGSHLPRFKLCRPPSHPPPCFPPVFPFVHFPLPRHSPSARYCYQPQSKTQPSFPPCLFVLSPQFLRCPLIIGHRDGLCRRNFELENHCRRFMLQSVFDLCGLPVKLQKVGSQLILR